MTLDLTTLLITSAVTIGVASIVFISEVWARDGETVDSLWSLAFAAALAAGLMNLVGALAPQLWWTVAIGNAATVLCPLAMWNGVRAISGRPSWFQVSLAAALITAVAVLAAGPDGGAWAGGWALLLGTAAGCLLAGVSILRSRLRGLRTGLTLALVFLVSGLFYSVRAVVFLTSGPGSELFRTAFGTEVTTLVIVMFVNTALFAMIVLRGRQAREREESKRNFDAMTGARTGVSFIPRAGALLRAAAREHRAVTLVAVTPEGLDQVAVAFGQPAADQALVSSGEAVQTLLPPRALMARDGADGRAFQVLLPGHDASEAARWGSEVRRELIDSPLDVPGGRMRLSAGIGLACTDDHGYDLGALCDAARVVSRTAAADSNPRVIVADGAGGTPIEDYVSRRS